ncbi:uncharacterized protein LOC135121878 [Zophobas morio]|uniref:uncharacterized protein LOC135121878 n=1 Tax=Zophobas morio TaxID=2755281 RepID=UPI0030839B10
MLHWNGFSSNQNADLVREESLRNPIYSCAWLSVDFEDCILAFGGRHGTIHLVSVALSSEIYKLNNENKEAVTFLSAASQKCGVFCSLSQSSGMARVWRLWARDSVTLQSSHKFHQPTTAEFIISNNTCKGNWDLLIGCEDGHFYEVSNGITEKLLKRKHRKSIDSIKQLSTGYIISKSVDGEVLLWDCFKDELIKVLIKPRMTSFVAETLSPLEVNFEGTFFCFGDEDGKVLVYDVQGKLISKLKHPKVKKMRITTCAFTNQSNQILCATEKSFIFRFDYISPEVRAIWDKFEDSVENDEENTEGSS